MGEHREVSPAVASAPASGTNGIVTAVLHDGRMTKHLFEHRPTGSRMLSTSPIRRNHRIEVARWALAHGVPMHRDDLSIIVATRDIEPDGVICTTWTCETVAQLLTWRAESWYRSHRAPEPVRLDESLSGYLRYLRETRLLTDRSDPFVDLLEEIDEVGASLGHGGRASSHEARRRTVGPSHDVDRDESSGRICRVIQLRPKKSSIASKPS